MSKLLLMLSENTYAKIGAIMLLFILMFAFFGTLISSSDPFDQSNVELMKPSLKNLMGTDDLGRDVYSRVVDAVRNSLIIGLISVLFSFILGFIVGSVSGYYGGILDSFLMRVVDVFLAFPYILGALALMVVLGSSMTNVIIAISVFLWTGFARMQRASVLDIKENDYINSAKISGASNFYIIRYHIMPNTIAPLMVLATISIQSAIMAESVLSFIHLGLQPPTPSLGMMLSEALPFIENAPWMMFFPGLILVFLIATFILFSEAIDDYFQIERKHAQR